MKWILIVYISTQSSHHSSSGGGFSAEYNTATACIAAKDIVLESFPNAFAHCTGGGSVLP